jgi:hypothetical protein
MILGAAVLTSPPVTIRFYSIILMPRNWPGLFFIGGWRGMAHYFKISSESECKKTWNTATVARYQNPAMRPDLTLLCVTLMIVTTDTQP